MVADLDRAVIDFAGRTYRHRGAQMDAVRSELGMTYTTYLLHLSRLMGEREAWEYAPVLMGRLSRRLTTSRRATRM